MNQKTTEFEAYKNKVYLELCLALVKDAHHFYQEGHYDLVGEQLEDILETFDNESPIKNDFFELPKMIKTTPVNAENK